MPTNTQAPYQSGLTFPFDTAGDFGFVCPIDPRAFICHNDKLHLLDSVNRFGFTQSKSFNINHDYEYFTNTELTNVLNDPSLWMRIP